MMGADAARNMYSSFPEINELCKVASCWKHIKRNILTMLGPLIVKFRATCTLFLAMQIQYRNNRNIYFFSV